MRVVAALSLSVAHRSHSSIAQSGRVFAASLIQLATESCTYRDGSARSGYRICSPRSGCCFRAGMCAAQTPRGPVLRWRTCVSVQRGHPSSQRVCRCWY